MSHCRELDDTPDARTRIALAIQGVFAGNIFDLGAAASSELFAAKGMIFTETRGNLVERPWAIDDFDAVVERLSVPQPYKKVVIFVDNAGSDVVLGKRIFCRQTVTSVNELW